MSVAARFSGVHSAAMDAEDLYAALMEARSPAYDEFDAHVVASILAISFKEAAAEGRSLASATGLAPEPLAALIQSVFARASFGRLLVPGGGVERGADEECLLDLLQSCTTSGTDFEALLAAMIARRAQRPNHLWQDLGLRNRGDLSELMRRHFRPLALRNSQDMKWKKFLYRIICADASYLLCTAPSCAECDDFDACFGEETGEALLARARRAAETG
jgi:nitrogen fixation protein NifQ